MPTSARWSITRTIRSAAVIGSVFATTHLSAQTNEIAQAEEPLAAAQTEADTKIEFAFKNAPFDSVLDFLSRESGVPVIFESDPPVGRLTYVSASSYDLPEAISILNLMLRRHDRYLRHDGDFMYLSSLPEAVKRSGESFNGELPEGVSPDQIVTVTIPLNNANASLVAEQIKPLLDSYGSVTPVAEQNILIVVETAAQVDRIAQVIATIDERRPVDSSYKLFPLRNAKPNDVVEALKGLVGQRVQRIIIDKDGKQRVVEDLDVGGLNIQADTRSNAVIVVGPESRIQTVEELIALLDADEPGSVGGSRTLVTLALESVDPSIAAQRVQELFASVADDHRPTIVTLKETHKIAIVGSPEQIVQATALVNELDPARSEKDPDSEIARVVALDHLEAGTAQALLNRLMTPRQLRTLRIVPGSDASSLIVAGPPTEIDRLESLLSGVDRPTSGSREVRIIQLTDGEPEATFAATESLYAEVRHGGADLDRSFDAESQSLTLIGTSKDIEAYLGVLSNTQRHAGLTTQSRTYDITSESPAVFAERLDRIVGVILGGKGSEPTIDPIDELNQIVVRAQPAQFALIEGLIEQITTKDANAVRVEVIRLESNDPADLIQRASELAALEYPNVPAADAQFDETSGHLILTGTEQSMLAFTSGLDRAQVMTPPARTTRFIDVQRASAEELVEPLLEFLATADSIDPGRRIAAPSITAVGRTNSLLVVAEPLQHQMIQEHVRRLDVLEQADLPPLRLLQLRTAEAGSIASMLTAQYRQRPQAERTAQPVEVRADNATNTLIVAAHEDLFADIKLFVDNLNTEQSDGPERLTKLFPLRVARASDVASAMDRLYPEPPVPLDRRGNPMPWLREPKQVTVSAEENSNSLIIDAPADRMASLTELAEQLDRVQIPAAAELRTYRVENADIQVVAQALNGLASRGVLSSPAQAGRQAVQVLIETEPRSKTLIVAGDAVTFEKVEQMLKDLSAVPVEQELRIVPIVGQSASSIAQRAQQIYEVQTASLPDAKEIDVTVDNESNSLEIVGETDSMTRFLSVLDELQSQAGPSRQIRLVELRASNVTEVAAFLQELLSTSSAMNQHGGPMPTFEAIESTNSILISATREDWAVLDPLIQSLDTTEGQQRPPLRILKLRSTDASNIATVLQQSFDRRSTSDRATKPVDIRADASTNTLIVAAHQDVLPEIESIVLDLNEAQAIDSEGRGIQIFPLKVARAEELARTIDQMYPEPPMPYDSRGRPRPDLRGEKEISVRADSATNSLIVDAPSNRLAGFEQLVRELDRAKATEDIEVRTYHLVRADLDSVSGTLRELADRNALGATGRAGVTISTEQRGKTLVVSGPSEIFDAVESLVSSLDTPPEMPTKVLRFYRLDHARADRLVEVLRTTLSEQAIQILGDQIHDDSLIVSISADSGSNTLVISAPEAVQAIAAELVEALDSQAAAGSRHTVRVISLTYADSNSVAPTLSAAAGAMDIPVDDRPLIRAVRGVNSIVVSGTSDEVERLAGLVESLDTRPIDSESPGIETFVLEHALSSEIAETVERLLVNQLETDPRVMAVRLRYTRADAPAAPKVRVESDDRTNTLVISAPMATLELARAIVSKLDTPAGQQPSMVTFTPARARPAKLAEAVENVLQTTASNRSTAADLFHEESSGSIVVTGVADEVARAVTLLSEFDERTIAIPETTFRTIQLQNASARVMSQTLTEVFADRTRWPAELLAASESGLPVSEPSFTANTENNSMLVVTPVMMVELVDELVRSLDSADAVTRVSTRVFSLSRGDAASVAEALSSALNSIASPVGPTPVVTAEPVSNSIVVAAGRETMQQVEDLVQQLDVSTDSDGVAVRTILLQHARAETLAPIIQQIVSRQSETDLMPSWMLGSYLANGGGVRQQARVIPEPRLNSLVVTAPIPVLDLVEQVVAELDVEATSIQRERPVRVLAIQNAQAQSVADTLAAIFDEESSTSHPPVVRVDEESNAIVVRADLEQFERIDRLVKELDEAAVVSSRQLRRITVDPSRIDATDMAELLRGLLEKQPGVSVEIMTTDDLVRESTDQGSLNSPSSPHVGQYLGTVVCSMVWAQNIQETDTPQPEPESHGVSKTDEPDVVITVDPATNTLVVTGSTVMTDRLAELAAEIERMAPPSPTRARVIRLPLGVDPSAVAQILARTSQQIGRRSETNPGGFTGRVSAAADRGGNSIVVWANDTDFESLGPLVAAMAEPASSEPRIVKVYPLSTVRANRALSVVRDFISPSPTGRQAQRLRSTSVSIEEPDGSSVISELDSSQISVSAGPGNTSLVVSAPAEAIAAIDRFVSLIDQAPSESHMGIRRYALQHADPQALSRSLTQLFGAQRQANPDLPRPSIIADTRSNTLLVSAASKQHEEIASLLPTLDVREHEESRELEIFRLSQNSASAVARAVNTLMLSRDPVARSKVQLSADDSAGVLLVRAPEEELQLIRSIVSDLDQRSTKDLPVHQLTLERADAAQVARAISEFFDELEAVAGRTGRNRAPRIAITADSRSGSIVVAASEEDLAQIRSLVETFDGSPEAKDLRHRIYRLQNARASDVGEIVQSISWDMQYDRSRSRDAATNSDRLYIESNDRLNAIVVLASPDRIDTIESIIAELDVPADTMGELALRAIVLERSDANAVARVVSESTATPGWRFWQGRDPDAVVAQVDRARNAVLLVGRRDRVELAVGFVQEIEKAGSDGGDTITSIRLDHARADRAASAINRFFQQRSRAQGIANTGVTVIGSADGNVIVIAANETDTALIESMIGDIDRPEMGLDREIEVYVLNNASVSETARAVTSMFPSRGGRAEDRVLVTPQNQSNSLIVSAPTKLHEPISELIAQLDGPPTDENTRIMSVSLESAAAADVAASLREALPESIKVKITPVERSNSLLLTGSNEAIQLVLLRVQELDSKPVRDLMEFRRVRIQHADAFDVFSTLRTVVRSRPTGPSGTAAGLDYDPDENTVSISATADDLENLLAVIEQVDTPRSVDLRTEFVPLEYADATQIADALEMFYGPYAMAATTQGARRVTIVPDAASNSLVISAEAPEWESIMTLLGTLDSEEYDTSRQLAVIKLEYADASSVAGALNSGFRETLESGVRRDQARQQARQQNTRNDQYTPPVLIRDEELPTVSPERETNSLVVFATHKDLDRIRAIVDQIDRSEFVEYPDAQIIAIRSGRPSEIATAVRELYSSQNTRQGARSVLVFGDDSSRTLIVRAEERAFLQIRALAEAVQDQSDQRGIKVRVLALKNIPASRIQSAILASYQQTAAERGESLSIQIDRSSNALVIASTQEMFAEIEGTVRELDGAVQNQPESSIPGVFGSIQIVDIAHNDPIRVIQMLTQLGVTQAPQGNQPGLVGDPVRLSPLSSRRAIAVTGSPADVSTVARLIPELDTESIVPTHSAAIIPLHVAEAQVLVRTLGDLISPTSGASGASPALAASEHLRRLSISQGADEPLQLDLSTPIRLIADSATNSVIVSSSEGNVSCVRQLAATMDTLPMGEAVVIRVFPMNSASAERIETIISDLFRQGANLGVVPGTTRSVTPRTATGQALQGEIALTVDERSNSLIVAGQEEAVALVEVLVSDLDADQASTWVEPTLIQLEHAEPRALADRLNAVLVDGLTDTPESVALQRQAGRIRLARSGGQQEEILTADLFTAAGTLLIEPEPNMRALLVLASPSNLQVVRELVSMLDVEAASASNTVRLFPLEFAAADRIVGIVTDLFRERESQPGFREEDRVIASLDARTNTLIITTSPESFAVLSPLIESLDSPNPNYAVGLHVVAIDGGDASQLAPKIQRLMRERIAATQRTGGISSPLDSFTIEAEPATNSLIVAASDENMVLVRELVDTLTGDESQALVRGTQIEVIALSSTRPSDAAAAVDDFYVTPENQRRGPGAVGVIANQRLNALVVRGTPEDISAVRDLVAQIDTASPSAIQNVKRIELETANAYEVVQLLEEVLSGRSVAGARNRSGQATKLRFYRQQLIAGLEETQQYTETEIDAVIREQVSLTPELRTNSVLVAAPPDVMAFVESMIVDLDTTSAGTRKIEKFRLANADARAMADVLRNLFSLRQSGQNNLFLVPTGQASGDELPDSQLAQPSLDGQSLTPVPDDRQQLAITIDARTNTLLVSATEEYLKLVSDVVEELDSIIATEREQIVFDLQYAQADQVETTLQQYFQSEADRIRGVLSPGQGGSLTRQLEQEVTVVGDAKSQKVLISASPRYIESVRQIVRELDAPPPQVIIQVLLAEVTLDESDQWGLSADAFDIGGDSYDLGFLGAGASLATALGVPNLSVSSTDFSLLVRALQAQGKLQILSNPRLTVNNNEAASIQVGENVALPDEVETLNDGRTRASIRREDVGVLLSVTPSISSDGFVRLDIQPEISTVTERTTQITEDFAAPIISTRKVDTTVTVRDGQTVVIGGLIQTTQQERFTKVPLFGDIPLVGSVFRSHDIQDVRTELLIILTPQVVLGGDGNGSKILDMDTQRAIEDYIDPVGLRSLLEKHVPGEPVPEAEQPVPAGELE